MTQHHHLGNVSMKVKFLIVGSQKSGTSALNKYLHAHPRLCMARRKEVHFFDNEQLFSGDEVDYSHYHSFFSPRFPKNICGETTPNYMYWYNAPRRIWEYNPKMKLIFILRNPIDRAFSGWNMEYQRKREFLPFAEAIRTESQRIKTKLPFQHRIYSYVDRGFYTDQIRRFWHFFPRKQTLFLKHEQLRDEPQAALGQIWKFLGIQKKKNFTPIAAHTYSYTKPMSVRDRAYLVELYKMEINDLEQMLEWDCQAWLSPG
jgi:hypothetical protein